LHLVVGLGNPGARYARTRHNVGFLAIERLAQRWAIAVERKLFGALAGDGAVAGHKALLAMPQQYMNVSGQATGSLMGFYKVPLANLLVIHDDMDLPYGRLRLRLGGGHGGHNGIRDIQRLLGNDFVRVRVGVGRPPAPMDPADYVLGTWTPSEAAQLDPLLDTTADAVEAVLREGLTPAMNRFNQAPAA
jgi:PTH1 family peptidyl-tRNA hydrolase